MSVRTKTLIVICLTFLALLGILYFTAQWFLLRDASVTEQKSTTQDVTRLLTALDGQITAMDANVGDWAPWDDTYEFISSGDPAFIVSNLPNVTFTNLGVELMLFINNSGQIVFGKMVDLDSGVEIPIPESIYSELQAGSRLLSHKDPSDKMAGILSLSEGPMLIASQPILTSQGEGPIRGTLIMGRRLNEAEIAKLSQMTQLSLSAFPYNDNVLPDDVALARNSLVGVKPIFVAPQSETVVSGYTLINDVYGNPSLILRIESPREAITQAKMSMRYLGLALIVIGIVLGLVTLLLLERMVIIRLTRLNSNLINIGSQGTASSRVEAKGNDEIFVLATSVNSMLDSIENSRAKEQESEEKFRSLFNNAEVGMFRTRLDGSEILDMNERFLTIFGLTREEMLGSASVLHWADPHERMEMVRQLEGGGQVKDFECGMLDKQGQVRRCLMSMRLYREQGILEGSILDITERKQAEEALRKSETNLKAVLQSTADGILAVGSENEVLYTNQHFAEMWRIPPEAMASQDDSVLLQHVLDQLSDPQGFLKLVQELYKSKKKSFDMLYFKDGRVFERLSYALMQGTKVRGRVWSFRDITERKQAEEAQQQSEILFRALFEASPDAVMLMDPQDPNVSWPIIDCNAAACVMNGYRRDELIGHSIDIVNITPGTPLERIAYMKQLREAGSLKLETFHRHKNGTIFPIDVSSKLIKVGGRELVMGIDRDITERKQTEAALLQSEAELRALFASMHDVVLVIGRDGVYRKVAPTNPGLLVKPPLELLGKTLRDVFPPEQAETFLGTVQHVLNTKQTTQIEYDLAIGDRIVRFETSISPMTEDSTLWVAHDVTERKKIESVQNAIYRITQAAITSEGIDALYRSIHSILGELIPAENFYIALIDPASNLLSFPYYVDQFDEPPTEMTQIQGLTGYVIRSGRPLLATREIFDRLVQQGEVEAVGTVGVDWMGAPLSVEGHMIGIMAVQTYAQDAHFDQEDLNLLEFVSTQVAQAIERKRMEQEIRNLSLTDELTGLYNRRGFTLMAEHEVKLAHRMKRTMLLFFGDVDNLKTVNDAHGHAEGDLALKEVSAILKKNFREVDILARFGGDEFVVLALDASLESAEIMTKRLRAALEARNQQADQPYCLTLSLGIARYDPEAPYTLSELIAQADGMMYNQKQARKVKE